MRVEAFPAVGELQAAHFGIDVERVVQFAPHIDVKVELAIEDLDSSYGDDVIRRGNGEDSEGGDGAGEAE